MSLGKLTVFNRILENFALKYGSFRPKIVEKKRKVFERERDARDACKEILLEGRLTVSI